MFPGFDAWVRAELARDRAPSVSVAVGRDDEVVGQAAFGLADVEERRAASTDTAYLLASVTKPMTATCACLLAARGQLDLDAPIHRYLGEVALQAHGPWPVPTVRQVLQHRGGLGRFYRFFYQDEAAGVPLFAETTRRYGRVFFEPGSRYLYSNLGYGLIDECLRNVTGQTIQELMHEELFEPLSMSSGWFGAAPREDGKVATRYAASTRPYPVYDTEARGASLAWASAPDLVRFGLAHLGAGGRVLPAEVARVMADAPADAIAGTLGFGYGLGWTVKRLAGLEVVSHAGLMGGVAALLALVPTERIVVAVLSNATASHLPWVVTTRLLAEALAPTAPDLRTVWDEGPDRPQPPSSEILQQLAGWWGGAISTPDGDVGVGLEILADGVALMTVGDHPPARATLAADPVSGIELTVPVRLPTADAGVRTDSIGCTLELKRDALSGVASAEGSPDGLPDVTDRYGSSLPHRCELRRV